ncbi:hypothetical protein GCM10027586_00650 [Kineococcus gypseus]|uniref:hypothetical protein n=1 Tax=Kineococcus gypseus TaxID=1637102 RepID=UPI003D7E6DA8
MVRQRIPAGTSTAPTGTGGGGVTLKAVEDAARSVWAIAPSAESGLTAVAANNSTDDTARLQAILNYVKATYGGGDVHLPNKTMRLTSTLTIPSRVRVLGTQASILNFSSAPDGTVCVSVNDTDFTPFIGVEINGKGTGSGQTGLKVKGFGLRFVDVRVDGFKWGVDMFESDTYINSFDHCVFVSCQLILQIDLGDAWSSHGRQAGNSGERTTFLDCTFANSDDVYFSSGSGAGLHFVGCSFDFVGRLGSQWDSHAFFDSCHFEFNGGTYDHAFRLRGYSRLTIGDSNFICGGNLHHLVWTDEAPGTVGGGRAHVSGSHTYHPQTPAAQAAGALRADFSEWRFAVPTGATSVTVSSFLISSWSTTRVQPVAVGTTPEADVRARVSAIDPFAGTATITLSAPAPAGTVLEVSF